MNEIKYISKDYEGMASIQTNQVITYYIRDINCFKLKLDLLKCHVDVNIICKLKTALAMDIDINHSKDSSSNVNLKVVTEEAGLIYANINGIALESALNVEMNERVKVLATNDIRSKINPNFIINNSEVVANHGVSIGNINTDSLYYLMSKGYNEEEAKALLVKGFLLGENPTEELIKFME